MITKKRLWSSIHIMCFVTFYNYLIFMGFFSFLMCIFTNIIYININEAIFIWLWSKNYIDVFFLYCLIWIFELFVSLLLNFKHFLFLYITTWVCIWLIYFSKKPDFFFIDNNLCFYNKKKNLYISNSDVKHPFLDAWNYFIKKGDQKKYQHIWNYYNFPPVFHALWS